MPLERAEDEKERKAVIDSLVLWLLLFAPPRKVEPGLVVAIETLADGLLAMVTLSIPPRSILILLSPLLPPTDPSPSVVVVDVVAVVDMFATTDIKAASPPCESTIVVMHEFSGSGGSRTRVIMPGTISEKCLETKVDMRDDLPTPSVISQYNFGF